MNTKNTNCLEGIRCPKCGQEDYFEVRAHVWVTVTDEGTEDWQDLDWDDDAPTECRECGHRAEWNDFRVNKHAL